MKLQKKRVERNVVWFLAGLVLCASLIVSTGGSASPQLRLVKMVVDRAMQEESLRNIGMEIADAQRDYVIGYATQRQVEQVQNMGVDVHILDPDIPQLIKVSIDLQELNVLADLGLDITAMGTDYIHAIARKDQVQAVRSRGFPVTVLADNIYRLVQPSPQKAGSMSARGAMPPPEKYHTYSEVVASFRQLEAEYPHIARMMDMGDSVEGRDIWAIKISDNPTQDEAHEPEILFVGCHHAREWIAVEVPFRLVHYLIENYETDARVRAMVDGGQIYIVPIVNPDGYVYTHESWTQRFWRKNRRDNGDGTFGVDLNRNYDCAWGITTGGATSSDPSNELYHGPAPFSEPETQTMRDFMLAHDLDLYEVMERG